MATLAKPLLFFCFLVWNPLSLGGVEKITVTRQEEGDTFTNPFGCSNRCPSTSAPLGDTNCVCKCSTRNTWMQNDGKCVLKSGCHYTMGGDYIPAKAILSRNVDDPLSPETLLLYKGSKAPKGEYTITGFQYLKDKPWASRKKKEEEDFYFQGKGDGYVLMERIQTKKIKDYVGAVLNFTLAPSGQPKGCLLLKIEGTISYKSNTFPVPQIPTESLTSRPVPGSTVSTTIAEKSQTTAPTLATSQGEFRATENTEANPESGETISVTEERYPTEDPYPTKGAYLTEEPYTTEQTYTTESLASQPAIDAQIDDNSNTGAIVGGVAGGVLGLVLIVAVVVIFWRMERRKEQVSLGSGQPEESKKISNPNYQSRADNEEVYIDPTYSKEALYTEIDPKYLKKPLDDGYEIPVRHNDETRQNDETIYEHVGSLVNREIPDPGVASEENNTTENICDE
eukprot:m.178921 g.178921  ORF g.178921 m.178921 type:complete len:453 (+) comp39197_c0_seq2:146-1504(+)